jgi:WD40 repeat protein
MIFDGPGEYLAVVHHLGGKSMARIWELATQTERTAFEVAAGTRALHIEDGGTRLFVQGTSTLSIYDVASSDAPSILENVRDWTVARGNYFAIAQSESATGQSRKVSVFNYEDATLVAEFEVQTELGSSMAFSPDGALLYIGTQVREGDTARGVVHVWDVAAKAELRVLEGHGAQVTAVAFSSDGNQVATSARDNTARVWNAADGTLLTTCIGHADNVLDVAFSPDGTRLVTASQDGTFKIWSTQDGREILTLQSAALGAEGQVVTPARVHFSPDGGALLTLTTPAPLAPRVLRAFPQAMDAYPGDPNAPLADRLEAYKRTK